MSVTIFAPTRIDPSCSTPELHNAWRQSFMHFPDSAERLRILEQVILGNDVVEIGCSVFGGIAELCRVTKPGTCVGLHQMILDGKDNHHDGELRFGTVFRRTLLENGVHAHPITQELDEFYYLEK